ncbi:thioredoxin-like protein AAED1, chloroplastic [Euphorbia lathyris]|uniref:thioredoxin-like protein AAED1, chloroplastic n=1 Tax=Euphorbia lathyris TaxID=212925 RepID=UPI0033137CE5
MQESSWADHFASSTGSRFGSLHFSSVELSRLLESKLYGIPISDIWKDREAVIAFARHFGCVFCRKRADYLASKKIMDASGVELVLIGPGSVDQVYYIYILAMDICCH